MHLGEPRLAWLDATIREHLQGVSPAPVSTIDLGGKRGPSGYAYACKSLLAAMWLQFAQAEQGGAWRVCKGCQRIFVQGRKDQVFHSKACRNRTNVRIAEERARELEEADNDTQR